MHRSSIESLITVEKLFSLNNSVFVLIDKNACILYVPVGAKDTYAETEGWSEFNNIVEKDFTGIDEVFDESKDAIYDLQGKEVESPSKGLYIIDGKKVFIK